MEMVPIFVSVLSIMCRNCTEGAGVTGFAAKAGVAASRARPRRRWNPAFIFEEEVARMAEFPFAMAQLSSDPG